MYRTINLKKAVLFCFAALLLLLLPLTATGVWEISAAVQPSAERPVILLDAGHGGVDPGAIGVNDALEKDINLEIVLRLRDMLTVNGWEVILTRDADLSLHDPQYTKISQIKTSDLKKRLQLIEESDCLLAISVHQNQFSEEKYKGAQMFYGRLNANSKRLAECMQEAFRENLQPENERQIKSSTSDVYIIHNANKPIVLAECGFLSNREECTLLCTPEYQNKVAFTLFCGIQRYCAELTEEMPTDQ